MCRQRGGGHLQWSISWNVHKNDNVVLRDLKLGGKIMHELYFVRSKVQLITSNISRLIRVFDMLLFLCHPVFVQKYQFKALTQWRILSMFRAFCPKEPDYQNLRCKTLSY